MWSYEGARGLGRGLLRPRRRGRREGKLTIHRGGLRAGAAGMMVDFALAMLNAMRGAKDEVERGDAQGRRGRSGGRTTGGIQRRAKRSGGKAQRLGKPGSG